MSSVMKGSFAALAAGIVLSGCASNTAIEDLQSRVSDLESSVNRAERQAGDAMSAARSSEDAEARRLAQRALEEAQDANERIRRVSDNCCGQK